MTILVLLTIEAVHGQVYSKIGNNPGHLDSSAALEIDSRERGFLPPRMKETERNVVPVSPDAVGLLVWCKDCDSSGQLCVYLGSNVWASFTMLAASALTTAGNNDAARPVRESATSATISGTLAEVFGTAPPAETGVVWREITDNDFAALPVLNTSGTSNFKATSPAVTTAGSPIKVTIPNLTSANPYSFRTYAKSPSGINYGNVVIFNIAPPKLSIPVVTFTDGNTLLPVFKGKLNVNAGTPKGTITEYGYYSGATNPPPTTEDAKVVLSATATGRLTLDLLNEKLNSETFTANPVASLVVNDYNVKSTAKTWFRYYAVANGETVYSDTVEFTPVADPITGGTAIADFVSATISKQLKIGEVSGSNLIAKFKVTKTGTYAGFTTTNKTGATTGLSLPDVPGGSFTGTGYQTIEFPVNGTPDNSIEGNSFTVSRTTMPLSTGAIKKGDMVGAMATCDELHETEVKEIFGASGKKWMDRNLGASSKGTSKDDINAYGCLYQWGRGNDGHASFNWTSATTGTPVNGMTADNACSDTPGNQFIPTTELPSDWRYTPDPNLWQGVNGINNPCPAGFRVPTIDELYAELVGVTNAKTIYSSSLKLTHTKFIFPYGGIAFFTYAHYWSSTANGNEHSYNLWFDAYSVSSNGDRDNRDSSVPRGYGFSVRCIKN